MMSGNEILLGPSDCRAVTRTWQESMPIVYEYNFQWLEELGVLDRSRLTESSLQDCTTKFRPVLPRNLQFEMQW